MTARRLRWIALAGLVGIVGGLEIIRGVLYPVLLSWPARLLMAALVALALIAVYMAAVPVMERIQAQLVRRNRELDALYRAGLEIASELDLESVLRKIVERARELVEARYGALAIYDRDGGLLAFLTSGVDSATRDRIGSPPRGRGLLGVVLHDGETLRLHDLTEDPRFEGFPEGHPPMRGLLAVPVEAGADRRGNLYVACKRSGADFTAEDESTLHHFAAQAAVAVSNAQLHRRLRALAVSEERTRIAHEMHDGLAQVLAYLNAKLQAVRQHVVAGDEAEAVAQLDQLALAAREAYADVRDGIFDLRAATVSDGAFGDRLAQYVQQWSDRTGIACRLRIEPGADPQEAVELQLTRIVQEALTNVRKHADAAEVELVLRPVDGRIELVLIDDGIGFDPQHPRASEGPRFGLTTMRERAESIGATFEVESSPGDGTRVLVRVPMEAHRRGEVADARAHR